MKLTLTNVLLLDDTPLSEGQVIVTKMGEGEPLLGRIIKTSQRLVVLKLLES